MKLIQRITSETPGLFKWLRNVTGTLSALFLTLSATVPADQYLFNIKFLSTSNMMYLGIILGVIAGTYQLAKKDR